MTPERHQQIGKLYHDALELEASERRAFLAQACNGDEALRKEVESLIASHELAGSFIESPALDDAAQMLADNQTRASVGQRIGTYEIIAQLGEGGMGEVYVARDKRLGRKVALKLLPTRFTQDQQRVRRFQQEARIVLTLNHPNIVTIYEIGESDNTHFIATEMVEGETLRDRMIRSPRIEVLDALDITLQTATALVAAHQAGIVHRDIKPENIMLRPDGYVKVLDFGLAKLTERPIAQTEMPTLARVNTDPGMVMGTIRYMSPEQARALVVDQRTDIWSLGVVLYEMLTGHTPFEGATTGDMLASILGKEPPPMARYASDVSPELQFIVTRMLRKDREERYSTIKGLASDLRNMKQEMELQAKLDRSSSPESDRTTVEPVRAGNATDAGTATATIPSNPTIRKESSAEYVVASLSQHKRGIIATLSALLLVAVIASYFYLKRDARSIDSIAVLPFVNSSADPNTEYLSDGITENIINSLSQLTQLRVMARSTVFQYKGKESSPQTIGNTLGVRAVLTGRVLQQGDRLIISAELVNVADGAQLWGEQYNRPMSDIFAVQEEIAREISGRLRLRLTSAEQQQLTRRDTENSEAYQAYLKGRYYWYKFPAPGYEKSREFFEKAIALDPNYALGYNGLSYYYGFGSAVGILPPNENWPKAEAAAKKALALDDKLADAYNSLAGVELYYHRNWPAAERYFRRGIEVNPKVAELHHHYGVCLVLFGRGEEAVSEEVRAIELEPLSLRINLSKAQRVLMFMRQYDLAIEQLRKTLELDPNFAAAHEQLGFAYERKGMQKEAIAEWQKAFTFSGDIELAELLMRAFQESGFTVAIQSVAQKQLERMSEKIKRGEYVPAMHFVRAYTRLGDKDEAFAWLEKAYEERSRLVLEAKVDPSFDSLRSDSRFTNVMNRLGL